MSGVGSSRPRIGRAAPGLHDAVASEWLKVWTWPAGRHLMLLAPLLASAGSAGFVLSTTLTTGRDASGLGLHDRLTVSLLGADLANVTMIVFAVLAVAGELTSGQIALTLQVTPRRGRVFAAKLIVLAALATAVGIVSTLSAFGTGQLILRSEGVALPAPAEPGLLRLVWGTMLMVPVHVILAATLTCCLRSAGLALAAVFVIMCLPSLAGLLPGELGGAAQWILPGPSLHTVSGASVAGDLDHTAVWAATAVLCGWTGAFLATGLRAFRRA